VVVSPVHEHVHQRAGQEQDEGQRAEKVCPVFGEQVEAADHHGNQQREAGRRAPEGRRVVVQRVVTVVDGVPPCVTFGG
jgi:hypothetical protein